MATPAPPPSEFEPDEVSVILRRAIDLAAARADRGGEALSAVDLADVASQAGIPAPALAAALAEARAGFEPQRGLVDRLIGPAKVGASTTIPTDEATAAANLQRWLEVEHGLNAYIRQDGVVVATRRGGLPGAIGASVRRIQGTGGLNRARSVQAATAGAPTEPTEHRQSGDPDDGAAADEDRGQAVGAICVVVDVSNRRAEAVAGGTAVAGGGAAAIGVMALVAGPLVLITLPAAAAAGWATARLTHRRTVGQVSEQVAFTTEAAAQSADPANPAKRLLQASVARRTRRRGQPR